MRMMNLNIDGMNKFLASVTNMKYEAENNKLILPLTMNIHHVHW